MELSNQQPISKNASRDPEATSRLRYVLNTPIARYRVMHPEDHRVIDLLDEYYCSGIRSSERWKQERHLDDSSTHCITISIPEDPRVDAEVKFIFGFEYWRVLHFGTCFQSDNDDKALILRVSHLGAMSQAGLLASGMQTSALWSWETTNYKTFTECLTYRILDGSQDVEVRVLINSEAGCQLACSLGLSDAPRSV